MAWDYRFKNILKDKDAAGGTSLDGKTPRVYAPKFRLQIGTPIVSGKHIGSMEEDINPKVLEISSHVGCCSQSASAVLSYGGKLDTGHPFMYGVGLTNKLVFGAQSINPRTYMYSGATLQAGVTQWAASAASMMPIGTLAKLQILISNHDVSDTAEVPWTDIFVGTFNGMTWNGVDYTLDFSDGLTAAKTHFTQQKAYVSPSIDGDRGMWFAGCGLTTTVHTTVSDYTDSELKLDLAFAGSERYRFGYTYKKDGAFGGSSFIYGSGASTRPQWVHIRNSANQDTWAFYDETSNHDGGSKVSLKGMYSNASWAYELPGYDNLDGEQRATDGLGGIGATSTVTNVCVIAGTPVTELINTVYFQGYHEQMVPGIFARAEWGAYSDAINWEDCTEAHGYFNAQYNHIAAGDAVSEPFRYVATQPVSDGLSLINRLTGKWGVFPRYKEGGYGVGTIKHPNYSKTRTEIEIITSNFIEGADYSMRNDQMQGSYFEGNFISKDKDNALGTSPLYGEEKKVRGWRVEDFEHKTYDAFRMSDLTIVTEDCAAGYDAAEGYSRYMSAINEDSYGRPHCKTTLRLRGLHWAHLAPGDYVDVNMGAFGKHWGPRTSWNKSGTMVAAIDSNTSTDPFRVGLNWLVTSSHVDWLNCKVTLTLSMPVIYVAEGWDIDWYAETFHGGLINTDQSEKVQIIETIKV